MVLSIRNTTIATISTTSLLFPRVRERLHFKTKSGREVDFIAIREDKTRMIVQVCESLADPQTKQREIMALSEAMRELKITSSTIVTRREEGTVEVDSGTVSLVPAWRFLLSLA